MKYLVKNSLVASMIKDGTKVPISLENGFVLSFINKREGISFFHVCQAYASVMGSIVCLNEEQLSCLEEIPEKIKADVEEKPTKVYALDPSKTYSGDEGIDYIILYLQNNDLSSHIERDDSRTLFVNLGNIKMFPDAEKTDWIMKLNSRIPLKSAMSIGCRMKNGIKCFGIILHDSFV